MNRFFKQSRSRARQARSEDRIEEESMWISRCFGPELLGAFDLDKSKFCACFCGGLERRFEVRAGIALGVLDAAKHQDINGSAFVMKQPRNRGSVAAVVASTADYQRAFVSDVAKLFFRCFDGARGGNGKKVWQIGRAHV